MPALTESRSGLDNNILTCGVPGFTGHLPGYRSENLHGHSYGFLTNRRRDMISADKTDQNASCYRRDYSSFEAPPALNQAQLMESAKRSRNETLPILTPRTFSSDRVTLADSHPLCRVPGYTGHIPHSHIDENLGAAYARHAKQGYLSARSLLKTASAAEGRVPRLDLSKALQDQDQENEGGIPERNISTPIVKYAGFIPQFKEVEPSLKYREALGSARLLHSARGSSEPQHLHVGFTPSMKEVITNEENHPPGTARSSRTPAPPSAPPSGRPGFARTQMLLSQREDQSSQPVRKAGYTGFAPQEPRAPEQYHGSKTDKAGLYFGDLTQYWKYDNPYQTTYSKLNEHAPKVKARITPRRN